MNKLQRLNRTLRTLGYLKPSQLIFWVIRRKLPARKVSLRGNVEVRPDVRLSMPLSTVTFREEEGEKSFYCHNEFLVFKGDKIDWCPKHNTRLWRYQLHYFELLRDPRRTEENKAWFISDWIEQNPQCRQPAWEPYTVSLRIFNWITFFTILKRHGSIPQQWLNSLYEQVLWLERNDEKHVLANHYFENIKAWLFAGVFFSGADAERWLGKGQKLLMKQLDEQFLADGGHYEGSAQYHSVVLAGCIDLYNLAQANPAHFEEQLIDTLVDVIKKGLNWLSAIVGPNERIPLFNDATLNGGPSLTEMESYTARLQITSSEESRSGLVAQGLVDQGSVHQSLTPPGFIDPSVTNQSLINQTESGIYGYRSGGDWLVITCADIKPSYQPGHSHCDLLSYELVLKGASVVVDTGVYEYEPGAMRNFVRSTKAHNTCCVDGGEQSEIWGEFRLARRAHKLAGAIVKNQQAIEFKGQYHGFFSVRGQIVHSRKINVLTGGSECDIKSLAFTDEIEGCGNHTVESYIHLHPEINVEDSGNGAIRLFYRQLPLAVLVIPSEFAYAIEASLYCPEFGRKIDNQVIIIRKKGRLPMTLSYTIEKL